MYSPGRHFPPLHRPVRQVDLVPTLSLLMGVPIPFSNLGTVIYEVFSPEKSAQAVQLNYEQIRRLVVSDQDWTLLLLYGLVRVSLTISHSSSSYSCV